MLLCYSSYRNANKKNAKTMTIQDDVDPYGHQASYNQSLIVGEKQAYTKS
jgi:hypothetical protein